MRPRYTGKDKNHNIVTDFMRYACGGFEDHKDGSTIAYSANYHGYKFIAHDCANIGGVFADYLLECVDLKVFMWVEVKTGDTLRKDGTFKEYELQDGENWLKKNSSSWRIVITDDDVRDLFDEMMTRKDSR